VPGPARSTAGRETPPRPPARPRSRAALSAWKRRQGDDEWYRTDLELEALGKIRSPCLAVRMEIRLLEMCVRHRLYTRCDLDEEPEAVDWVVSAMTNYS